MRKYKFAFIAIASLLACMGFYYYLQISSINPVQNNVSKLDISNSFQVTGGCSNIFVYKKNETDDVAISVSLYKDALNISNTVKTFNIKRVDPDNLNIELEVGDNAGTSYCNDVIYHGTSDSVKSFTANAGEVVVFISNSQKPNFMRGGYTVTVILRDIYFVDENGNDIDMYIEELIFSRVNVGFEIG